MVIEVHSGLKLELNVFTKADSFHYILTVIEMHSGLVRNKIKF